jgi:hypothetical protein
MDSHFEQPADKTGTFYFSDHLICARGSYGGCTIANYD